LQNPLPVDCRENLLPKERVLDRRMRGDGKSSSSAITHRLRRFLLTRRARVIFWRMDSATSPFGSAQNDRVRGIMLRMKVFKLENPNKRESGAFRFFIDALSTGFV